MTTKTGLTLGIWYNNQWNTVEPYTRNPVACRWGVAEEGKGLTPSRGTATLDNRTGDYNPDDPTSSLYGLIGRNTRGRLFTTPNLPSGSGPLANASDTFSHNETDTWNVPETGGYTWGAFGAGGSFLASDYQIAGGLGTHSVPTTSAYRASYLSGMTAQDVDVAVTWKVAQATGGNLEPGNIMLRGTTTTSYVLVRTQVTTSNQVQLVIYNTDSTQLGSVTTSLTHAGTGTPLRTRAYIAGTEIFAKVWDPSGAEPAGWDLRVTDTLAPRGGWVGIRSGVAAGNTNTKPVVFSYDNFTATVEVPMMVGDISSWRPDQAIKGDAWTDVEITGPSQRINNSGKKLSALRKFITDNNPVAYWAMDTGRNGDVGALTAGTGTGFVPVTSFGTGTLRPGEGQLAPWLEPAGQFTGTSEVQANVTMDVPATSFAVDWIHKGKAGGPGTFTLTFLPRNENQGVVWQISFIPSVSELDVSHTINLGTPVTDGVVDANLFLDSSYLTRFTVTDIGGGFLNWNIDDVDIDTGLTTSTDGNITASLSEIGSVRLAHTPASEDDQFNFGHLAIWGDSAPDTADIVDAFQGHRGETAGARFLRLCSENGLTGFIAAGTAGATALMGSQYPDTLANQFIEIMNTDDALIYDAPGFYGLNMVTGNSRHNHSVGLALTYGTNVHPPIRPVIDDLNIANQVTAVRRDGGTEVVEKTTGLLNSQDPLDNGDGIGLKPERVDVNPEFDSDVADLAGWHLHLRTWPGARYESVTVNLTVNYTLYDDVTQLIAGDWITVAGYTPDTIGLYLLGVDWTIESNVIEAVLTCRPSGPYNVGVARTSGFQYIGSESSTLAADFDAGTDTSMSVATTHGGLWSTGITSVNIRAGGVVLEATAVSGTTSPQTFTITATPVNGVTRTIPAGTRVDVADPAFIGV